MSAHFFPLSLCVKKKFTVAGFASQKKNPTLPFLGFFRLLGVTMVKKLATFLKDHQTVYALSCVYALS
jgi:hypothetical protein